MMRTPLKLPNDYQSMPTPELLVLKAQMEERGDDIKNQLARVREKSNRTGEYANGEWYARALSAARKYGRDIQHIQAELAKRKHERHVSGESIENLFVTVARRRLDQTVFNTIMFEAREEQMMA